MRYLESLPSLAERLRALREAVGLTQEELGARCGWPQTNSRIAQYERAFRSPSYEDIRIIAAVLGVNPAALAFGADAFERAVVRIPYYRSIQERKEKGHARMIDIIWPNNLGRDAFALRVPNRRYRDFGVGEVIVIDPSVEPRPNDIVVLTDKSSFILARCLTTDKPRVFNQLNKQASIITEDRVSSDFVGVVISSAISRRS